jgi:hypothetical protein
MAAFERLVVSPLLVATPVDYTVKKRHAQIGTCIGVVRNGYTFALVDEGISPGLYPFCCDEIA